MEEVDMKVKAHPYKYNTVDVPDFLVDAHGELCKTCKDKEDCDAYEYNECIAVFINDNIGFFIEESKDSIIDKTLAEFFIEWDRASKAGLGEHRVNWFELQIDNKTYRVVWFGWSKEIAEGFNGSMLCYEKE